MQIPEKTFIIETSKILGTYYIILKTIIKAQENMSVTTVTWLLHMPGERDWQKSCASILIFIRIILLNDNLKNQMLFDLK